MSNAPLQASTSSSGELGQPSRTPEQLLVPETAQDLHVAGRALRAERSEPRELVAALCYRPDGEVAQCAHQIQRLALAGSSPILTEPDLDLLPSRAAVSCNNFLTSPELAQARTASSSQYLKSAK